MNAVAWPLAVAYRLGVKVTYSAWLIAGPRSRSEVSRDGGKEYKVNMSKLGVLLRR